MSQHFESKTVTYQTMTNTTDSRDFQTIFYEILAQIVDQLKTHQSTASKEFRVEFKFFIDEYAVNILKMLFQETTLISDQNYTIIKLFNYSQICVTKSGLTWTASLKQEPVRIESSKQPEINCPTLRALTKIRKMSPDEVLDQTCDKLVEILHANYGKPQFCGRVVFIGNLSPDQLNHICASNNSKLLEIGTFRYLISIAVDHTKLTLHATQC